jgi:hypothetical protein
MKITRDVIADLWPVYDAGEASADTRVLVDSFLETDPEFAGRLRATKAIAEPPMPLPHGMETKALKRTRDLVYGRQPGVRGMRLLSFVFLILASHRIAADTSWDRAPDIFLAYMAAAAVSGLSAALLLRYHRRRLLRIRAAA